MRIAPLAVALVAIASSALAAELTDVKGAKDPLFTSRMEGSAILGFEEKDFDSFAFASKPKPVTVEGHRWWLRYGFPPAKNPSTTEVLRNYENAMTAQGATIVYSDGTRRVGTLVKGGKEIWVQLIRGEANALEITIIEKGLMRQQVNAGDLLADLNRDGYVPVYIQFDTGKSDVKLESQPTVDQIVALLKDNAGLKLSLEGHTDNVGDAASNQKLSEARAAAVMAAVVKGGIDASRLSSKGFGATVPIADNRKEEGRALNRRVELVKK